MKHTATILSLLSALCSIVRTEGKEISLVSPDRNIQVSISISDRITYSISSDDVPILDNCSLALVTGDDTLGLSPKLRHIEKNTVDETIQREIPLKNAFVRNSYNSLLMEFAGDYSVEFRAFDNGVAYRFILDRKGKAQIFDEDFTIGFAENCLAHLSLVDGFKTSYEQPYSHIQTAEYRDSDRMSYLPVLVETPEGYNILISESDLKDYPGMFLKSTGDNGMTSIFPRCPESVCDESDRSQKILAEHNYIASTEGRRSLPWRFFVISDDDRDIIANEMEFVLSTPCEIEDCSWIRPGQVSWEWWHDARLFGVDFRSGYNMDSYKYYIDFASSFGIPYIIMDEGWAKSTTDPFTPNPEIDLHGLIKYAAERNVKIILWLTWLTVDKHMDVFKTLSEWGIAGVKIDFMDRSDQWMVNFYERVAKEAARNHMLIDFHGSFKPAGLERRYPNILSYEGVLGMEQGSNCKPSNSIYLPFIRNAVGPMDFTPGSMISAQPEDNRYTRANAMGSGTRAYQIALYIVFESGLQMLADNPVYYYRERPCTEFITGIPTVWDETRVLAASTGDYAVIARRSGDCWYIGAITDENPRDLEISLSPLGLKGKCRLIYFQDGINADRQAMDYKKGDSEVEGNSTLTLKLVRNGGWAGVIRPE